MNAAEYAGQVASTIWQGALFILVVALICRFTRVSARTRYWLWWLACAKLLVGLVPMGPIQIPILRAAEPAARPIVSDLESVEPPITMTVPAEVASEPVAKKSIDPFAVILALWGLGVLARGAVNARGAKRLADIVRRATPIPDSAVAIEARKLGADLGLSKSPMIYESSEVTSPMVAGLWRPVILIPEGFSNELSEGDLRLALAHELAHIRRHDLALGLVPMLADTAFFFLPPAWFAYREWITERETVCDEDALRQTGAPAAVYGALLLRLVSRDSRAIPAAIGATAGYHTLKRRMMMIKSFGTSGSGIRLGAVALALAVAFVFPWQVTAQPQGDAKNLLRNSSLEENSDGWVQGNEIDGVKYMRTAGVSHSGKGSLAILKSAEKYFPVAQWSQPFKYDGKAKYLKVGSWVKSRLMTKAVIDVQFMKQGASGAKEMIEHKWAVYIGSRETGDPPADHDWKEMSGTVPIPEGTQDIVIGLQVYGPGNIWFDDITASYSEVAGPSASDEPAWTGGSNQAVGGDFENGLEGWTVDALPTGDPVPSVTLKVDETEKHGGNKSVLFAKTENNFFPVKLIRQGVTIEKGKHTKVRVSVWIKAENAHKLTVPIFFDTGAEDGTKTWAAYVGAREAGGSAVSHGWKQYTMVLQVPPDCFFVSFGIEMYGPGRVWVDDLEVSFK